MSVKRKLMAEIEAKAKKMKEKKNKTRTKADLEALVFGFFKEAEDLGRMKEFALINEASNEIRRQIQKRFDPNCQVQTNYTEDLQVSGITITWSKNYQIAFKSEEQFHIDVADMLFS